MATLKVLISGMDAPLSVRRFDVRERLSGLFRISIVACSERHDLDLDQVIFKAASFSTIAGWAYVRDSGTRHFTGLCCSIKQIQVEPSGLSTYAIEIVPCLWLLTLREDYRIFQNASLPSIITEILELFSIVHDWHIGHDKYPRLNYKVQYGETDYDFFRRLCEEAGITFYFRDDEARGSVLVLSDAPCAAPTRDGEPIAYVDNPNTSGEQEYITCVRLSREGRSGTVTLRDYDFRNPSFPLYVRSSRADSLEKRLEIFRYVPGAFRAVKDGSTPTPLADKGGAALHDLLYGHSHAERMLAGRLVGALALTFKSNALDIAPGTVLAMAGHPHPRLEDSRRYLVTQLRSRGKHSGEWKCHGRAVLTDNPYRPPAVTAKPVVQGLQSAHVTGPNGREIFTDEHGRVRVQFPWDRQGNTNEHSSCWIRVAQGWAGAGFGLWTVPRIGQEVLVGFLEGDPDEPVIIGRAPNAHNPPPYPLPANETKSVWRSKSTPQADGFNELSFEDRKGEERIYEKAQRDKETLIQNDERLTVGGTRQKLIKADEDSVIAGNQKKIVGEGVHVTIKGDRRMHVEGSESDTVDGNRNERICGQCGLSSGGQLHLSSDTEVIISAPAITLQGAGGFMTINAGGLALHGAAVTIMQGGAPGSGFGISPIPPVMPTMAAAFSPAAPANVTRLPMFGFRPVVPFSIGPDVEQAIICQAICNCKDSRGVTGRGNAQQCVTTKLRQYDASLGGLSTIKAEVPYDMSQTPPAPIMSKNHPGPTSGRPAESRIPDITVVNDGTKSPTQDNIRLLIEVKFPPDDLTQDQRTDYPKIAGSAPFQVWGPECPCSCAEKEKERVPYELPAEDVIAAALLALTIVVMVLDDIVPGGQADDPLLPPIIAKLIEKLAPLLTITPVMPSPTMTP